jgi:hypothetical protein
MKKVWKGWKSLKKKVWNSFAFPLLNWFIRWTVHSKYWNTVWKTNSKIKLSKQKLNELYIFWLLFENLLKLKHWPKVESNNFSILLQYSRKVYLMGIYFFIAENILGRILNLDLF